MVPELPEVLKFYENVYKDGEGFLLNPKESFDLVTEECSALYVHCDIEKKYKYIEDVLSKQKLDYEHDENPTLEQILELIPAAFKRYNRKRQELNFLTDTNIYIYLPENKMVKISANDNQYEVLDEARFNDDRYVTYKTDYRLLYRILRGAKYAHWNNAEIGSHIEFSRHPEIYERKLYYSMNFFHQ